MSMSHSKNKATRICSKSNKKTEKKKPKLSEFSPPKKCAQWMQKLNIPSVLQEGSFTQRVYKEVEQFKQFTQEKCLRIATASHIRINRARVFDWLLDVCRAFQLRWQSFWSSIQLIDFLIFKLNLVTVSNIHLVAITCLFISNKIHQTEPPLIDKIIDKAVYNAFSAKDMINMEAEIILYTSNAKTNPNFIHTIYATMFQMYPQMSNMNRVETLRRLLLIWMDPLMAMGMVKGPNIRLKGKTKGLGFDNGIGNTYGKCFYISYRNLLNLVVRTVQEGEQVGTLEEVWNQFMEKYECSNIGSDWNGFHKIRF